MRPVNYTPVVIFEVNAPSVDQDMESIVATGIPVSEIFPLMGCYLGKQNPSYMVEYKHYGKVLDLASKCGQFSILLRDSDGLVYEIEVDNPSRVNWNCLGVFKGVSKDEALKHNNWSYRPALDQYYITTKEGI